MNALYTGLDKRQARIEELEKALRFLVDAAETEPGMAIYAAHIAQAKAALKGEEART